MAEEKPTQDWRIVASQHEYARLRRSINFIVAAIRLRVENCCDDKKYTSYCTELARAINTSGILSYSDERLEHFRHLNRKTLIVKVYEDIEIAFNTDNCSDLPDSDRTLPFLDPHWPCKDAFIDRIEDAKWILESDGVCFNHFIRDQYTTAETLRKRVSAYQHVISTLDKQSGDLLIALIESSDGISTTMYQWLKDRKLETDGDAGDY